MIKLNFEYCAFVKSNKKGIYDKLNDEVTTLPYNFLKFEPTRDPVLVNSGAVHVLMSFNPKGIKILHTGLIKVDVGLFYGNNLNAEDKKDFIIIDLVTSNNGLKKAHFYQFKNYIPKNKLKFTLDFIENYNLNE